MDSYIGNRPLNQAAGFRHEVYATAGQTVFPVAYAVGYLDVFQNGVKLGVDDFTATDGATVTLVQGAAANDLIAFIAWAKGTMAPVTDFVRKAGDTMTGPLTVADGSITVSVGNILTVNGFGGFTRASGTVLALAQQNAANDTLINGTSGGKSSFIVTRDALVKYAYADSAGSIGLWPAHNGNGYISIADGTFTLSLGTRGASGAPYLAASGASLELRSTVAIKFPAGVATTTVAANAYLASGEGERLYRSTSSAKYKQNVETLASSDLIDALRPVTYDSLCEHDAGKHFIGFVVEELAAADPRLADVEEESYDYRALLAIAVAEIQSLRRRVAALEAA